MKKNLMSVLILALLVVNIALTSIMMFSVMGTAKKTSAIVTDIASVLKLELTTTSEEGQTEEEVVPIENVAVHNIPDKMTLTLKNGEDGSPHFAMVSVSFSLNTKDKGYKKYAETLTDKDPILKDIIIEVFANHTVDEVKNDTEVIKKEILEKVQAVFDSKFIFNVVFGEITPS